MAGDRRANSCLGEWRLLVLVLEGAEREPAARAPRPQLALLPWPQQNVPLERSVIPKTAKTGKQVPSPCVKMERILFSVY